MKTQIIHRIILIAILISISYSNKGDNMQATMPESSITILHSCSSCIKKTFEKIASDTSNTSSSFCCIFCAHETEVPVIPEPNGEHEFHTFHIKERAHKPLGFWKTVTNKILEAIYYVIILFAYLPFKH